MGPAFPACIHGQSRAVSLVPRSTPVRPAAVAGSFYPGDPTRRHGGGRAPSMTTLKRLEYSIEVQPAFPAARAGPRMDLRVSMAVNEA